MLFLEINPWLVLSMAVLIGYVCSILVQNLLINRLKQIRMEPNKREEFIGRIGKVLITILPGTTGSVVLRPKPEELLIRQKPMVWNRCSRVYPLGQNALTVIY